MVCPMQLVPASALTPMMVSICAGRREAGRLTSQGDSRKVPGCRRSRQRDALCLVPSFRPLSRHGSWEPALSVSPRSGAPERSPPLPKKKIADRWRLTAMLGRFPAAGHNCISQGSLSRAQRRGEFLGDRSGTWGRGYEGTRRKSLRTTPVRSCHTGKERDDLQMTKGGRGNAAAGPRPHPSLAGLGAAGG